MRDGGVLPLAGRRTSEMRRSVSEAFWRCLPIFAVAVVAALGGCDRPDRAPSVGDAKAGEITIERQACGNCHIIPGIQNSIGLVGPSLDHFGSRRMVAGLLANTPPDLVRWLRSPQTVLKGNAMPDMGLSERQARDVAAYLYTLK